MELNTNKFWKSILVILVIIIIPLLVHVLIGCVFQWLWFHFSSPESHASFYSANMTYVSAISVLLIALFAPYLIQRKIDSNTKKKELIYDKLRDLSNLVKECQLFIINIREDETKESLNKLSIQQNADQISFDLKRINDISNKINIKMQLEGLMDLQDKFYKTLTETIQNKDFVFNSSYKTSVKNSANALISCIDDIQISLL